MCTVSAALSPDGLALRVVINRDERRTRMQARPPEIVAAGGVPAVWPIDQHAGGTWVAVNAHGVALALLNESTSGTAIAGDRNVITRGAIIPHLAGARDLDDVTRRFFGGPALWRCRPFKLLAASLNGAMLLTVNGTRVVETPLVVSSSTLGDALVEGVREQLFGKLLAASAHAWEAQDRLHRHAWPDRRHLSVLMSRADACTVSRTEIIITRAHSEMRYAAVVDGWPCGVASPVRRLTLPVAVAAA